MTAYKCTEESVNAIINDPYAMQVAKIPEREMITKCVAGEKYFCTDTGEWLEAKEGEALITRVYEDGTKDTYKNKKGPKYKLEGGKSWDDLKSGESAYGILETGIEYDRYAFFARPGDTVEPVWGGVGKATRPNAFVTVIYADRKFDISNEDTKYDSKQPLMNNNAGDLHPVDPNLKDENGNPMIIGKLPITASPKAREAELREYVAKNYNGEMPKHLLPVIRNINAEKNAGMSKIITNTKGNDGK